MFSFCFRATLRARAFYYTLLRLRAVAFHTPRAIYFDTRLIRHADFSLLCQLSPRRLMRA